MTKILCTHCYATIYKINFRSVSLLLLTFFALLASSEINAQSPIVSYSKFIESNHVDRTRAIALANDLQKAVYVENGEMNVYGDAPVCLYTDMASQQNLEQFKIPMADIEMVHIKILSVEDLNFQINYGQLSNFPKLKYIYISAPIDIPDDAIRQMATGSNNYIILFNKAKMS